MSHRRLERSIPEDQSDDIRYPLMFNGLKNWSPQGIRRMATLARRKVTNQGLSYFSANVCRYSEVDLGEKCFRPHITTTFIDIRSKFIRIIGTLIFFGSLSEDIFVYCYSNDTITGANGVYLNFLKWRLEGELFFPKFFWNRSCCGREGKSI